MTFEEALHSGKKYRRSKWKNWAKTEYGLPSYVGADDIFVVDTSTGRDILITDKDRKAKDWETK